MVHTKFSVAQSIRAGRGGCTSGEHKSKAARAMSDNILDLLGRGAGLDRFRDLADTLALTPKLCSVTLCFKRTNNI